MAHLTEEELNAIRGMHYADGGSFAPVYFVRQDLVDKINEEWGRFSQGPYRDMV